MTENDPTPDARLRIPDPAIVQPPAAAAGGDPTPPGPALPPGAGSPLVPGPAMSVREPIDDRVLNKGAVMMFGGLAVVAIILIVILVAVLHH